MLDRLTGAALALRRGLEIPGRDPLLYRRVSSPQVRLVLESVAAGVEAYAHAGNSAAKTEELAALFVRMCRGQARFDARLMGRPGDPNAPAEVAPHWIDLPGLIDGEPWRHWVLVNTYDQAKDSSMRAYRRVIGRHPHTIGWIDRSTGKIKLIRIKPDGWHSDDPETWSEITFISQENMTDEDVRTVQGARVHSVHGDEMPKEAVWREVRARRIANRKLYLAIGATPEYKPEWEWCLEDFRGAFMSPLRGRIRVQWSVDDNRALSLADIEARKQSYLKGSGEKSDLYDARVDGEHVDVSGKCPFPVKPIVRMLEGCQRGRIDTIVLREGPKHEWEPDYRDILPSSVEIERWLPYERTHAYLIVNDTSRGIDDGEHDPGELQVWDWTEGMLVARFGQREGLGGYLDEDSQAILADILGREYGNALVDCEVNGGFGVQFFLTLRKLRYPNLAHDDRSIAPGVVRDDYGWVASATTNGEIVNAIIRGLNEDSFLCWSRDVLNQWADVREDSRGRPASVAKNRRHHREAMICAGRALHTIQSRPAPVVRLRQNQTDFALALRKDFGRDVVGPKRTGRQRTEIFRGDAP